MAEGRVPRRVFGASVVAAIVLLAVLLVFVPALRAAVMSVLAALWSVLAPIVGAVALAGAITLTVYLVWRSAGRSISLPVGIAIFLISLVATIPGVAGATVSGSLGLAGGVLAALIALIGVVFAQALNAYTALISQRRELASARDDALQGFLQDMKELRGDEQPDQETMNDHKRAVVRAKVRTALLRLDGNGKAILLRFLHETGSIKKATTDNGNLPPNELHGADLSCAKLRLADLHDSDLRGVNLRSADLREADLTDTDLRKADLSSETDNRTIFAPVVAKLVTTIEDVASLSDTNLSGANLSYAVLRRADLSAADLSEADLSEADLEEADLSAADLRGAKGITEENIAQAKSLEAAILPNGQEYEEWLETYEGQVWYDRYKQGRGEDEENSSPS
jgi:uncharacterized protein YjbI with pentapeptide repeats